MGVQGLHSRQLKHTQFSLPVGYMTRVIGREHSWTKSTLSNCPPRSPVGIRDAYMSETHNHLSLETAKKWGKNIFFSHHKRKFVKMQEQILNKHLNAEKILL